MWKAIPATSNSCFIYSTWKYSRKQIKKKKEIVEDAEFTQVSLGKIRQRKVAFPVPVII
jgi:hypothetical protein